MSRSYIQEGQTKTRRTEIVTSVRLVETNEAFKHVQEVLDWIQNKQVKKDDSTGPQGTKIPFLTKLRKQSRRKKKTSMKISVLLKTMFELT